MDLTHDYVHAYAGYQNLPSRCRIRIYEQDGQVPVVIATELPDNPGTSVTNMAEQLCAAVIRAHFPARFEEEEPVRWLEHYRVLATSARKHPLRRPSARGRRSAAYAGTSCMRRRASSAPRVT